MAYALPRTLQSSHLNSILLLRSTPVGEYPAAFAVCTGQKECIRYLLRNGGAGAREYVDAHGNTLLHMAVAADRLAMYDFLVDECGCDRSAINVDGDTPLQLAVRLDKFELMHHILYKHREVR